MAITSTTEAELPSPTARVSITNPHPTRRMLVRVDYNGTVEQTNTIGANEIIFTGLIITSGTPTLIGTIAPFRRAVVANETSGDSANVYGLYWVPAGTSASWGVSGWRTNSSATVIARNVAITATPIRYE